MACLAVFLAASLFCPRTMGASLRQSVQFQGLGPDTLSALEVQSHARALSPMALDALLSQATSGGRQSHAQIPGTQTLDSIFGHAGKVQQDETTLSEAPEVSAGATPAPTKVAALMPEPAGEIALAPTPTLSDELPTAQVVQVLRALPSTEAVPMLREPVSTEAKLPEALPGTTAGAIPVLRAAPPEGVLPSPGAQTVLADAVASPEAEAVEHDNEHSGEVAGPFVAANSADDDSRHISREQHERLQIAKPITWFHVPKCGTTFANTLFHHPDICPHFPEKALISRVKAGIPGNMLKMILDSPGMYGVDIGKFTEANNLDDLCEHSIDTKLQGLGHNAIGTHWSEVVGHSMIFFRQPEQRIISAYRHGRHGCLTCDHETKLAEYAPLAAGCITRMLTREGDDACVNAKPPTLPDMALAIQRLRSGFVFVGITEQWDMSICLFHVKYGGECHAYEMVNTRPGRYLSTDHPSYYDTEELGGFTDVFDRQLYMEAEAMFEEDVERYGLTRESCARLCGQ